MRFGLVALENEAADCPFLSTWRVPKSSKSIQIVCIWMDYKINNHLDKICIHRWVFLLLLYCLMDYNWPTTRLSSSKQSTTTHVASIHLLFLFSHLSSCFLPLLLCKLFKFLWSRSLVCRIIGIPRINSKQTHTFPTFCASHSSLSWRFQWVAVCSTELGTVSTPRLSFWLKDCFAYAARLLHPCHLEWVLYSSPASLPWYYTRVCYWRRAQIIGQVTIFQTDFSTVLDLTHMYWK